MMNLNRTALLDDSSSSEEDTLPMLPETSSGELSIGEGIENRSETSSHYISSKFEFDCNSHGGSSTTESQPSNSNEAIHVSTETATIVETNDSHSSQNNYDVSSD